MRSRSAKSAASRSSFLTLRYENRSSFLTLRYENAFTPSGCARCTRAPSSARASAAQYQPYVASGARDVRVAGVLTVVLGDDVPGVCLR